MLGVAAVLPAFAQSKVDPVNKDGSGVAIKGYDPVAYFTQGKPVEGSASFTHAPQYGGYCAYGVSQGHAVNIDPEAWTVMDGKLYLNYSKGVKKTWSETIPKHIEEANRNWPGLHK